MNFNIGSLLDQAGEIASKLDENVSIEDIINTLKLPDFGSILNSVTSALPQNLVNIAKDGALEALKTGKLDQALNSTINSLQNEVLSEAQNALNSLTSAASQSSKVIDSAINSVKSVASSISNNQSSFYNTALKFQNTVNNTQNSVTTSATSDNIIKSTVDSVIRSLSNNDIKKLKTDKNFYNQTLQSTISSTNTKLYDRYKKEVNDYTKGSSTVQAINSLSMFAKEKLNNFSLDSDGYYEVDVNMGTFTSEGSSASINSVAIGSKQSSLTTASGRKQNSGNTCSVDNNKILLNSTVVVPGIGTFYAVDVIKNSSAELLLYYGLQSEANMIRDRIKNPTRVKVKPPKSSITTGSNLNSGSGSSTPTQISSTIRGNFQKLV